MSIRHICDCCGKNLGRTTLFQYRLTAPVTIDNLEICRDCFYRIRDEIIKENEKRVSDLQSEDERIKE